MARFRVCCRCGEAKPLGHFYQAKGRRVPVCADCCDGDPGALTRFAGVEAREIQVWGCRRCGRYKPVDQFLSKKSVCAECGNACRKPSSDPDPQRTEPKPRRKCGIPLARSWPKENSKGRPSTRVNALERRVVALRKSMGRLVHGLTYDDVESLLYRAGSLRVGVEVVAKLWARCRGLCEICGRKIYLTITANESDVLDRGGNENKACCDHDHGTGQVRGFLCTKCNLMVVPGYEAAVACGENKVREYLGMAKLDESGSVKASSGRPRVAKK